MIIQNISATKEVQLYNRGQINILKRDEPQRNAACKKLKRKAQI